MGDNHIQVYDYLPQSPSTLIVLVFFEGYAVIVSLPAFTVLMVISPLSEMMVVAGGGLAKVVTSMVVEVLMV